jgi:hypothetical protein
MSGAAMTKSYSRRDFPGVALAAGVLPILPAAVHAASPCSEASRRRRPARQVSRGHRPICPRRKREHHYNLWLRSGDQHPGIEGHLVPDHGGVEIGIARKKLLCDATAASSAACVTACKNEHEVPWASKGSILVEPVEIDQFDRYVAQCLLIRRICREQPSTRPTSSAYPEITPQRPHCLAGLRGLELANIVLKTSLIYWANSH